MLSADLQSRGVLDVWYVGLDVARESPIAPACLQSLETILSPDEQARAARFHFERDRRRFVVCRARLREILASYLDAPATAIRFVYGEHGKPALTGPWECNEISFNLSHSEDLAVIAVARGVEVGIDVECVRPIPEARRIAERCFSIGERAALEKLPAAERPAAFYGVWTRKEACLKAIGTGLSYPLDQIDVGLANGYRASALSPFPGRRQALEWSVWSVSPAPGYVAAVASTDELPAPDRWQWLAS